MSSTSQTKPCADRKEIYYREMQKLERDLEAMLIHTPGHGTITDSLNPSLRVLKDRKKSILIKRRKQPRTFSIRRNFAKLLPRPRKSYSLKNTNKSISNTNNPQDIYEEKDHHNKSSRSTVESNEIDTKSITDHISPKMEEMNPSGSDPESSKLDRRYIEATLQSATFDIEAIIQGTTSEFDDLASIASNDDESTTSERDNCEVVFTEDIGVIIMDSLFSSWMDSEKTSSQIHPENHGENVDEDSIHSRSDDNLKSVEKCREILSSVSYRDEAEPAKAELNNATRQTEGALRKQIEEIYHSFRTQKEKRTRLKYSVFSWLLKNGTILYAKDSTEVAPLRGLESSPPAFAEQDILDAGLMVVQRRVEEVICSFKIQTRKQKSQFKKMLVSRLQQMGAAGKTEKEAAQLVNTKASISMQTSSLMDSAKIEDDALALSDLSTGLEDAIEDSNPVEICTRTRSEDQVIFKVLSEEAGGYNIVYETCVTMCDTFQGTKSSETDKKEELLNENPIAANTMSETPNMTEAAISTKFSEADDEGDQELVDVLVQLLSSSRDEHELPVEKVCSDEKDMAYLKSQNERFHEESYFESNVSSVKQELLEQDHVEKPAQQISHTEVASTGVGNVFINALFNFWNSSPKAECTTLAEGGSETLSKVKSFHTNDTEINAQIEKYATQRAENDLISDISEAVLKKTTCGSSFFDLWTLPMQELKALEVHRCSNDTMDSDDGNMEIGKQNDGQATKKSNDIKADLLVLSSLRHDCEEITIQPHANTPLGTCPKDMVKQSFEVEAGFDSCGDFGNRESSLTVQKKAEPDINHLEEHLLGYNEDKSPEKKAVIKRRKRSKKSKLERSLSKSSFLSPIVEHPDEIENQHSETSVVGTEKLQINPEEVQNKNSSKSCSDIESPAEDGGDERITKQEEDLDSPFQLKDILGSFSRSSSGEPRLFLSTEESSSHDSVATAGRSEDVLVANGKNDDASEDCSPDRCISQLDSATSEIDSSDSAEVVSNFSQSTISEDNSGLSGHCEDDSKVNTSTSLNTAENESFSEQNTFGTSVDSCEEKYIYEEGAFDDEREGDADGDNGNMTDCSYTDSDEDESSYFSSSSSSSCPYSEEEEENEEARDLRHQKPMSRVRRYLSKVKGNSKRSGTETTIGKKRRSHQRQSVDSGFFLSNRTFGRKNRIQEESKTEKKEVNIFNLGVEQSASPRSEEKEHQSNQLQNIQLDGAKDTTPISPTGHGRKDVKSSWSSFLTPTPLSPRKSPRNSPTKGVRSKQETRTMDYLEEQREEEEEARRQEKDSITDCRDDNFPIESEEEQFSLQMPPAITIQRDIGKAGITMKEKVSKGKKKFLHSNNEAKNSDLLSSKGWLPTAKGE